MPFKKLPLKLEKVYVISLDRDKKRYEKIKHDLDKLGIDHIRFSAVDGYKLKIKDLGSGEIFMGSDLKSGKKSFRIGERYKIFCPNLTLNYKYKPNHQPLPLSAGELGAACSHMEVALQVLYNNDQIALILEDDAKIDHNFKERLQLVSGSLFSPRKWDILYLGYECEGYRKWYEIIRKIKPILFLSRIAKITDWGKMDIGGFYAYMINANGAGNILDYTSSHFTEAVDITVSKGIKKGKIKAFALRGDKVKHGGIDSNIDSMGRDSLKLVNYN